MIRTVSTFLLATSLTLLLTEGARSQGFQPQKLKGVNSAAVAPAGVMTTAGVVAGELIDFEGFPAGTVLTSVMSDQGSVVEVYGINPELDGFANLHNSVIFNTNVPTGGDTDLGTPNELFGGPGIGEGGEPGAEFPNSEFQNNVLIIDEFLTDNNKDGLVDNPDDAALFAGGILALGFSQCGSATVHGITLVDVEAPRIPATVQFLDANLDPVSPALQLPITGDNGVASVDLGSVSGVVFLVVTLNGSGAIDNIVFEKDCNGAIGDFVWLDEDMDGIQDAGEPGIQGVTVVLTDRGGVELATTVTGPDGSYVFEDLCAGEYVVEVDETSLPPGLVPTTAMVGGNSTVDSNGSPADVQLDDDETDFTIDFGYFSPCTGSIGDFIWNDLNRDGIQDAGEPGIMGITVNLLDGGTTVATTTTDGNGFYQFSGLCAGTYTVAVDESTLPPDFVPSDCDAGGDDTIDNDCSPETVVLATNDSHDPTIDFGYNSPCTGTIGDFVWNDADRDGLQDPGEGGIQGVTIELKDDQGEVIATVVTNRNGFYQFDGLCAGDYTICVDEETLPPDFVPSDCNVGSDDTIDNDCSPKDVTLSGDNEQLDACDFGYNSPCTGTLGDFVWNDLDRDGLQDPGEPGIDNVTVQLKDDQGTIIATVTTGPNGFYQFDGLCAGDYTLCIDETTLPPDFVPSDCDVGSDDTIDNDCSPKDVTLNGDNEQLDSCDFGYNSPCTGTLGDFVWEDFNRDGVQDAGEPGIEGVMLILKNDLNEVLTTTTTDADGFYEFSGLCQGDYKIEVDPNTLPDGLVASPCNVGDDTLDNDCSPANVSLPDDFGSNDTIDFGYNTPCTGTIGDFIWNDLNRNGIQDAGEPGIEGVDVFLSDGVSQFATTTDADGFYEFTDLCAGLYLVVVDEDTLPPDFVPSPCNEGVDETVDNDCSPVFVNLLTDDSSDDTIDFGYGQPCTGTVGDFVWEDSNRDGLQDPGEPGIPGVIVAITDGDTTKFTFTDFDGFYEFTGLCAGTYAVVVLPETLPPGLVPSPCNEGTDDAIDNDCSPAVLTLTTDDSDDPTIDFGYNTPCEGAIGDFVWDDLNRDGIQDPGEAGIGGVVVSLLDAAGNTIDTTVTDGTGAYQFTRLCAGEYTVVVDEGSLPPGFVPSPCDAGGNDALDNDCSPANVTLPTDDATEETIDFGYNKPCDGSIGNFIWDDSFNRDGIQDPGEPGIPGVTVTLQDASGLELATTTTDADGFYEFTELCAGDYIVVVDESTLPSDTLVPSPCMATGPALDNNCSPANVTLSDDFTSDDTIDFGYNEPCAGVIGDFIWDDTANRDGLQDVDEPGIPDVTVTLQDDLGNVLATTTTDADGFYEFTELCAGDYFVVVDETTLPDGMVASPCNVGANDAIDNDCSPVGVSLPDDFTTDDTIDFGYNLPCAGTIGDFVWDDTANRNGIQDPGEPGLPGVTVSLLDGSGATIDTTVTDGVGFYEFTELCAGDYSVVVDETSLPDGMLASACNQGSDDAIDNDCSPAGVNLPDDFTTDDTIDFGYNLPCAGTIGDFVWDDTANRNGIQDPGEPGIPDVTVTLQDASGNVLATTATNGAGFYEFSELCAGDYLVVVDETTLPSDTLVASPCDAGGDDALDNDCSPAAVTLPDDFASTDTIDFGYNEPCTGTIGDFVWDDTANRNGIQDPGEPGLPGVTVSLLDGSGATIDTTVTNGVGFYEFTELCAGDYSVVVDETSLPDGMLASACNEGSDDAIDNDCSPAGVNLPTDFSSDDSIDFGYNLPCAGTIGDFIWDDTANRNGIQDPGEPGIPSVRVTLQDGSGNVLATTATNGAGFYLFSELCAGDYFVVVDETTLPSDTLVASPCDAGGDDALDNDCSPAAVTLPDDFASTDTIDFGYNEPCTGTIGDFVWDDTANRNGIQDPGEPGIPGVTVSLLDGSGATIDTTVTNGVGFYEFTELCAGDYSVVVDETSLPDGMLASACNQGSDDAIDNDCSPAGVSLPTDFSSDDTIDFGYNLPCAGTIGDFIWDDTANRNGIQDAGEPGIPGVTVTLQDGSGNVLAMTATNGAGFYEFSELCAGDYLVVVDESTLPSGTLVPSPCDAGGDDALDNDCSPAAVTLPDDFASNDTIDFGYNEPCTGTIGDFVWDDTANRDGIQDPGEPGIEGVTVSLLDGSGNTVAMATTDSAGFYEFIELCAGDYSVVVDEATLPAGMVASACMAGGDPAVDNNCSPATVNLPTDFSSDETIDFGYNLPCAGTIGDFIWDDTANRNGIQDPGEPGIPGVTVTLQDGSGNVLAMTVTNGAGFYLFTNLCGGNYLVVVDETTLPSGTLVASPCDAGTDDTVDNDCSPAAVFLPDDFASNDTIDFGYNEPCTGVIGDFVWNDLDRDGIQDPGEPGIEGVTVSLLDGSGSVVGMTTTSGSGFYRFIDLCAGDYSVVIDENTLPMGLVASPCMAGGDPTVDNNCSPATVNLPTDFSSDDTIDFGYNDPCVATIGDFVWEDLDRDGIQDAGEPGIPGVTVTLQDGSGAVLAMTATDGSGFYAFTELCAGDYFVVIDEATLPAGLVASPCMAGGDPTVDNNCSPANVNLPNDDSTDDTIDFGYNRPCSGAIGDFVWQDLNENHVQDGGEPGIEGVLVILSDDTGVQLGTTLTDNSGFYAFSGLCAGTYVVSYDPTTVPGDLSPVICDVGGNDAIDSDCTPVTVVLPTDFSTDDSVDFGFGPCSECDGKVNALTLQYLGDTGGNIVVEDRDGNTVFSGFVEPGEAFSFLAFPGEPHFGTTIKIYVNGSFDQEIHTSCSQPIGPGIVFGDYLVVAGSSVNGGLLCGVGNDCCLFDDIAVLDMVYTGESCAATTNDQEGSFSCSGDPMFASPVMITAFKDAGEVYFSGIVNLNEAFTIDSGNAGKDKLASTTAVEIRDLAGNLLQELEIHTSCSKPIEAGDQFGSLLLAGCSPQSNIVDECNAGKPQVLAMAYTGDDCSATSHSQDPDKVNCDGDPAFATEVQIVAFKDNDVWFDGVVGLGEVFEIDATNAGQNRLASQTFVNIYGLSGNLLQEIEFHTSCSQPLILGNQFGGLSLVGFTPEP